MVKINYFTALVRGAALPWLRSGVWLACLAVACKQETKATPISSPPSPPEWTRDAVIYEVNVRQYTPEGTFTALQPHLARLDSLGVDILWFMPIQPIGKLNRKGSLGSYYSISDYTATNPEFGTPAEFQALVDSAHQLGMRVILDWVPNHSAFDHPWATEHPDWYVRRADGSISNARDNDGKETDWTDVAELNYDNSDLRRAMIAEMKWWVHSMNVDGFRCDVAGGVPNEFWSDVRRELETVRPDIFLLAEAESPAMHPTFDMTYGWELYLLLNSIANAREPTSKLDEYFAKDATAYPANAYRMYFTSNHDENSWQGTEFERMGANHLPAFVLAATAKNGMPLLYTGQEVSLKKRLRFFEKDTVDWRGASLGEFYRKLFELKETNAALWNGAFGGDQRTIATDGGDQVYAFSRTRGDKTVIVAVNFGDSPKRLTYGDLSRPGDYTDWFSKTAIAMAAAGSLAVPAHGYRVLVRN